MNKNLLYIFLFVLASCNKTDKEPQGLFFGGEIVNPTAKYIVLLKDDQKIDSAKLDDKNRFNLRLDSISKGLYHFKHAPENQYIYLEPGDSIQVRLNTIDFDESLVFSGQGSDINNFLLELFLANEEEESKFRTSYFELNPKEFNQKIRQLKGEKNKALNQLNLETKLSKSAKKMAQVSIDYTYYNYKEIYPFEHRRKTGNRVSDKLPSDFYNYRKNLTFNNKNLNYLTPYYNFVKSYFKNISLSGCEKKCGVDNDKIVNQLHYNRHKLGLIDSLVHEDELKDNLFRNVAFEYLLRGKDTEKNNEIFITDFHQRSANNRHIEEINQLYEGIRNMQPNKKIPNIIVTDFEGEKISLREIAKNKKVVFYFWSGSNAANRRYFKDATKKIALLFAKNKDYKFVGINYRTDDHIWKGMIDKANLDKAYQFKTDNFEELAKVLFIYQKNKCIVTKNGKIDDGFTTLWAANL